MKTQRKKINGQGMTEYIIIVALIAIAAIAVYSIFGKTVRTQVGNMTKELAGESGVDTVDTSGVDAAGKDKDGGLKSFGSAAVTEAE